MLTVILYTILCGLVPVLFYFALPRFYRITERLAIALGLTLFIITIVSFSMVLFSNTLNAQMILVILCSASIVCFLASLKTKEINKDNLRLYLGKLRAIVQEVNRPAIPTIFLSIFLVCLWLIPIASIYPFVGEYPWQDVVQGNYVTEEIRQLEFLSMLGILHSTLLIASSITLVAVLYWEKDRKYAAMGFFGYAITMIMIPVLALGRPWGIDSYFLGWIIFKYDTGAFNIQQDLSYAALMQTLNLVFFKEIFGLTIEQTLATFAPLINSQIFIGAWIVFTQKDLGDFRAKALMLTTTFSPILLQYIRIVSTSILGMYFMLMTIWFIEKRYRRSDDEIREKKFDIITITIFAALTTLSHIVALCLLMYIILRPLKEVLAGRHAGDLMPVIAIGIMYIMLEINGFFKFRLDGLIEYLSIDNPLLSGFQVTIGLVEYILRPFYSGLLIGTYLLLYLIFARAPNYTSPERIASIGNLLYKGSTVILVLGGIAIAGLMFFVPSIVESVGFISGFGIEGYFFYAGYFFLLLFVPYVLFRNTPSGGYSSLLYIISQLPYLITQYIFRWGGGLVTRMTISLPLSLGIINEEGNLSPLPLIERESVWWLFGILFLIFGMIGGLLVSFKVPIT